jgi:hypothetical protein
MVEEKYMRLRCCGSALPVIAKKHGGARPNTGGARPGAGRPPRFGPKKPKRCALCGGGFYATKSHQRHCELCLVGRYRKLCDHEKPKFASGNERKFCFKCHPKPPPKKSADYKYKAAAERLCAFCSTVFMAVTHRVRFCQRQCADDSNNGKAKSSDARRCVDCGAEWHTSKRVQGQRCSSCKEKAKALRGLFSCLTCGKETNRRLTSKDACLYCSRKCAGVAKAASAAAANGPKLCAYFSGFCGQCSKPHGARREWSVCPGCTLLLAKEAHAICSAARNRAKHKAAGKVVECDGCRSAFCPMYGAKTGAIPLCALCAKARKAEAKAVVGKSNPARAKKYGVPRRHFNEVALVLARDGWKCRICGVLTPKQLRGTADRRAPEVDHIVPLSDPKSPGHVPENCQCACRACNGAKGSKPMGLFITSLI